MYVKKACFFRKYPFFRSCEASREKAFLRSRAHLCLAESHSATELVALRNDIEKNGGVAPSVLCVICGLSNAAYVRPDGVFVVPITALKN